ncbi:MAG: hypothetical protein FWD13_13585 [Treponema sp.]|nr:hypothetical protein [Treponema sp.]
MNENKLPNLKDNIHVILRGSKAEKEKLIGKNFYLADTPEFMKEKGLKGDFFSINTVLFPGIWEKTQVIVYPKKTGTNYAML